MVTKKEVIKERAKHEIQALHDVGLCFLYEFDHISANKLNIDISKEGFHLTDIISKLKPDETLTFMLNDGKTSNGKSGDLFKFNYNEEFDGSIYWEHEIYGDWVRVDSNMGSLQEWRKEIDKC
tara:strand:- start:15493 stop:15861 length:369 start_codon:yes stop_codon:yes gene_type:complete